MKNIFDKIFKKKEEETNEWYKQPPPKTEAKAATVWPPKPSIKTTAFQARRVLRGLSKVLFMVYLLLGLYSVFNYPYALIFIAPTLAVIIDYIRNQRIMEEIQSWWDPEEKKEIMKDED